MFVELWQQKSTDAYISFGYFHDHRVFGGFFFFESGCFLDQQIFIFVDTSLSLLIELLTTKLVMVGFSFVY